MDLSQCMAIPLCPLSHFKILNPFLRLDEMMMRLSTHRKSNFLSGYLALHHSIAHGSKAAE